MQYEVYCTNKLVTLCKCGCYDKLMMETVCKPDSNNAVATYNSYATAGH